MRTAPGRPLPRGLAATLAGLVVVACAATNPPDPSTGGAATASPRSTATARVAPERTTRPSPNRLELEVGQLDPAWVWPMLDFASDSHAVIWSSGVLDGPIGDGAPDLWRYIPGTDEPELLWRNPERARQLAKVGGDTDVWAFAEISSLGERWWNLWLLEEGSEEPILLDSHAGDGDIPSLVPSFDVDAGRIAWTSFDRGADGAAVSQIWLAEAPAWEPRLVAEAPAEDRAYWLPSLRGFRLAYVDVTIGADPAEDIRHVMLADVDALDQAPAQLDTSGNATMPVLTDHAVIWKEPDRGFAMFNWGRLFSYSLETAEISPLRIGPQDYVNYPSGGGRFVAMWGADSARFAVHDLDRRVTRLIASYDNGDSVMRPHVAGDLLVWLHARSEDEGGGSPLEYAWLPEPGLDRAGRD